MQDPWIRTWLSAMDINVNNFERLWMLLDNGDGQLTAEELVRGLGRLRGGAKSIHMLAHIKAMNEGMANVQAIGESVKEMRGELGQIQLKQLTPRRQIWLDSGDPPGRD